VEEGHRTHRRDLDRRCMIGLVWSQGWIWEENGATVTTVRCS